MIIIINAKAIGIAITIIIIIVAVISMISTDENCENIYFFQITHYYLLHLICAGYILNFHNYLLIINNYSFINESKLK